VAVYSGARPRSTFLPQRTRPRVADAPALPRRRVRGAVRARRRTNRLAFVLGGIVLVFVLAFFSLAQTVRVSATGYDLARLGAEREALMMRKQELLTDLNRLGQEPAVRKLAIDAGLTQLSTPIVVGGR
jgi:ABC-type sugar transport system permease subunit